MQKKNFLYATLLALLFSACQQPDRTLTLDMEPSGTISPTMYGVFLEDINYAADGGLSAQMVENCSFEFPQTLQGWDAMGVVECLPGYVRLCYPGHHCEATGLENRGFFGYGFREGIDYMFSLSGRLHKGKDAQLLVELTDACQNILAADTLCVTSSNWESYKVSFSMPRTVENGKLRMRLLSESDVDIDGISLLPSDHIFGLRRDLVEALHDLHPGIFRFPGGCIVEGTQLESRYNWKNSVGPKEQRPLNKNRWNNTFEGRYAPNYYQSYDVGFYEYFCLAEYIGASPIPVVNVGLSCQFHNSDEEAYASLSELQSYIQDALDLIEFANGDTSTRWGSVRAEMGHPEPFNMRILGIGNEQWGEPYVTRLEPFLKAIHERYPELEIVGSSGPFPEGDLFDYGWEEMRRLQADYVDEHYYKSPDWFLQNATRYDSYDRQGPKVFAGEYAAHIEPAPELREPCNKNTFGAALAEAAFMTGLERNADVVRMTAYAPLFASVYSWQWDPDLIWFNNLQVVRTPNYLVQQLFSTHLGTHMVSITEEGEALAGQGGLYASAAYDEPTDTYIVRLVNTSSMAQAICLRGQNFKKEVRCQMLHAAASDYNSIENPECVKVVESMFMAKKESLKLTLQPETFYVLTF